MEVVVDRIEENILVLELPNLKHVNISKDLIPDALEGDVVDINVNYGKRKQKEAEIKILSDKLFLDEPSVEGEIK